MKTEILSRQITEALEAIDHIIDDFNDEEWSEDVILHNLERIKDIFRSTKLELAANGAMNVLVDNITIWKEKEWLTPKLFVNNFGLGRMIKRAILRLDATESAILDLTCCTHFMDSSNEVKHGATGATAQADQAKNPPGESEQAAAA